MIGALWVLIMIFGEWQDGLFGLVIVANAASASSRSSAPSAPSTGSPSSTSPPSGPQGRLRHRDPARQVVLGDLVLLSSGDQLLVDGEVVDADGLEATSRC
ncbi:hypothetical protein [Streptosporangium vulgare]|uniref:hypothetical protein n=1 Tax=Streptosporangium vulgare TaxID=46190 RepID=UPI0031DC973F